MTFFKKPNNLLKKEKKCETFLILPGINPTFLATSNYYISLLFLCSGIYDNNLLYSSLKLSKF